MAETTTSSANADDAGRAERAGRVGLLRGVNPLTRIFLMFVWVTPLLLSVDWVSAAVSLGMTLVFAPLCGVSWPRLFKAGWFLFLIAPLSGISMLLYGAPGGREYFSWWLITVTDNSMELAIAITMRVLAVALPMVVLARRGLGLCGSVLGHDFSFCALVRGIVAAPV